MTLTQIRYVLAIAEAHSMNKAAEQLYISQPTLTGAIHDLEEEAGITIFLRTNKGVTLTQEGTEFLSYARQVYQQYELLENRFLNGGKIKHKFAVSTQHYSFVAKAFVEMVKKYDTLNFDFAIRETKTADVINDVGTLRSEIGVLFRSDYNCKVIDKLLRDQGLEFHKLIDCQAFVYLWNGHPLAKEESISFDQLTPYPCLSFEQGEQSSGFLSEEILTEMEYPRIIHATDRATMLNLMVGLNAYTLCSGIICYELNGDDFSAVPFRDDEINKNSTMEIGYIKKKGYVTSKIGETFLEEARNYLEEIQKAPV